MSGTVKAVEKVSFTLEEKETIGLVGESGCGKSTVALSLMQLVSFPGKIIGGEILFKNEDLLKLPEKRIRDLRGGEITMSYQDPMTFFNPVMRIGAQIVEGIIRHTSKDKKQAHLRAVEMLDLMGISSPEDVAKNYPHQLSGGMRQRAMMAMALACNPSLFIADEPTTALDVIIQSQLLDLMRNLKKQFDMATLVISHDLGVVAELCDKIAVMYAGEIVEHSDTKTILKSPKHPYTQALLNSIPRISEKKEILTGIAGNVPDLVNPPKGCKFAPRCPFSGECSQEGVDLTEIRKYHLVRCTYL
jgi:oligopeptide/dipeptide ABC transporter ATP-binding protein